MTLTLPAAPPLALSRTCDLADFPACRSVADWQQALAACATAVWQTTHPRSGIAWCVNGSKLPFTPPLRALSFTNPQTALGLPVGRANPLAAIYALSVLDHVDEPHGFLHRHGKRLARGGLFFLTFHAWDCEGPDVTSSRGTRARLYGQQAWHKLIVEARKVDLRPLGAVDWRYHGHVLGDHTLASLVLVKKGKKETRR